MSTHCKNGGSGCFFTAAQNVLQLLRAMPVVVVAAISSCDSPPPATGCPPGTIYYHSGGKKIFLDPATDRVWIELDTLAVPHSRARAFLAKYFFLDTETIHRSPPLWRGWEVFLREATDCAGLKRILETLNQQAGIRAATPLMHYAGSTAEPDLVLLPEVLTGHNPAVISEEQFIRAAADAGLVLLEATRYGTQHFRVAHVGTGWEALHIANKIFEAGKATYSHPNFIALDLFTTTSSETNTSPAWHLHLSYAPARWGCVDFAAEPR